MEVQYLSYILIRCAAKARAIHGARLHDPCFGEEEEEEEDVGSRRGAGVVNVRIMQGGGVEWRVKFGKLDCCVLISMGVQLMCLG